MVAKRVYRFARLSILPLRVGAEREAVIMTGLKGPPIESEGDNWAFLDLEMIEHAGERFLAGLLGRYQEVAGEETVDEERRTVVLQGIENRLRDGAQFFLHLGHDENLIAFHPEQEIPEKQFRERFIELFRRAHEDFFVEPWLEPVTEEMEIWHALRTFDRIFKFEVKLHKPNPRMGDKWRLIAEDLEAKNASEYREEYIADRKSSGLRLREDDPETSAKISMAEDGYGEARITGLKDGEPAVASTTAQAVRAEVSATEETREGVLSVLHDTFRKLWDRFSGT